MKKGKNLPINEGKGSAFHKYSGQVQTKSKEKPKLQKVPSTQNLKNLPKAPPKIVPPPQQNQIKNNEIKKQPEIKK